jgi:broad specificity phosphatase PhoE
MATHVYFVRHGQSEANVAGIYAGSQRNATLTSLGREQAATAGSQLDSMGITTIISSRLDRAEETARIIATAIGIDPSAVEINNRLTEIDVGALTGQPDRGFSAYLEYVSSGTDETAESIEAVTKRLVPLVDELHHRTGVILLVSHAGIERVLRMMLGEATIETLAQENMPNAQPIELSLSTIGMRISS